MLLLSTYDLGRQPFGLASPAAWLRRDGVAVLARDLSRTRLDEDEVAGASVVAFYLPMHTATRLALPIIDRVRALNPSATLVAYGLYAPLSDSHLRARGVSIVLGPEAEDDLVRIARGVAPGPAPAALPRLAFIPPVRDGLPPLPLYATLQMPDGTRRVAGATDASRGCKHRCRHCPIVPVYNGHFRIVAIDVVLADVAQQVAAGATHITFGDPDFFNAPTHARRLIEALHARFPSLTYDVTIKVEHLLKHRDLVPLLAATGCLFVTSAVEALDDDVLRRLEKGHTRQDVFTAVDICRRAGVTLAPTFVAFTPWTTMESYRDLLATVDAWGLVEHVAPVQWGLRLLITSGSRLLELPDIRDRVQPFNPRSLTYPWRHDDERVDAVQQEVMHLVGVAAARPRQEIFAAVCEVAGVIRGAEADLPSRATIPYLNEPWYC